MSRLLAPTSPRVRVQLRSRLLLQKPHDTSQAGHQQALAVMGHAGMRHGRVHVIFVDLGGAQVVGTDPAVDAAHDQLVSGGCRRHGRCAIFTTL